MDAGEYFSQITRPYCSLPAESGSGDAALLDLCQRIDLATPICVVDYACGRGRFLSALSRVKSAGELSNLHYVGVDIHDDVLAEAEAFFRGTIAATGAKAAFLQEVEFWGTRFLADYVIIVFAVHELDPLNLDRMLGALWRMLRRGGKLIVQDCEEPIYKEIEFMCFRPQDIQCLLPSQFGPSDLPTSSTRIMAGRSLLPVFIFEAQKPLETSLVRAYLEIKTTESYLDVLHRSLLRDAFEFMNYREAVDRHEHVDSLEIAKLCHRISSKSRAYHQVVALDEFQKGRTICVRCGSKNTGVKTEAPGQDNWGEMTAKCQECGYEHTVDELPYKMRDFYFTESLLSFLDSGLSPASPRESVMMEYQITMFFAVNWRIADVIEFLLDRVRGIDKKLVADVKERQALP